MIFWQERIFQQYAKSTSRKRKDGRIQLHDNLQLLCIKIRVRRQATEWTKTFVATKIFSFFVDSLIHVCLKIIRFYFPILNGLFLSCNNLGLFADSIFFHIIPTSVTWAKKDLAKCLFDLYLTKPIAKGRKSNCFLSNKLLFPSTEEPENVYLLMKQAFAVCEHQLPPRPGPVCNA